MSLLEDVFSLTKKEQIALLEELEKKASAPSPIALPQEVIETFELPDEIDIEDELAKIKEIVLAEIQSVTINAPKGDKGDKGDKGAVGPQGPKGIDGVAGKDGKQGVDGKDGIDGISVTDARVDFDGSLVITLSSGQEINAGDVIPNDKKDLIIQSLKNSTLSLTELGIEDFLSSPTPIGDVTPNTGKFTSVTTPSVTATTNNLTLSAISTGAVKFNTLNGEQVRISDSGVVPSRYIELSNGSAASRIVSVPSSGNSDLNVSAFGTTGNVRFFTNNLGQEQLRVSHTASAVNIIQVTGATTSNRPRISFEGSDGNIGGLYVAKGSGGHSFCSDSNASVVQFAISRTASAVNFIQVQGASTGNQPFLTSQGNDANAALGIASKGNGDVNLYTNGGGQLQLKASHTASAVNYVQVTGSATGANPAISVQGSDSIRGLQYQTKSTGAHLFYSNSGSNLQFRIDGGAASVNYLDMYGNTAGLAPSIRVAGSDTNINLNLVPKGTGTVQQNGTPLALSTHKYHAFNVGSYYYDSYNQDNYLRLFTQNATTDTIRYGTVTSPEYYDYGTSTWTAWAAGQSGIQNLLDGNPGTSMDVAHANRTFRFIVNASDGWPTNALVMLQSTWSAVTYTTATVTIESSATVGGTYTSRQVMVFSPANTGNNWGMHAYYASTLHTGNQFYRITIDLTDWVDSGIYLTYPLRNLSVYSNYSNIAGRQVPYSNSFDKTTAFIGGISTPNDANGILTVGRYSSGNTQAIIDTPSSTTAMLLRTQSFAQVRVAHTASAVNYVELSGGTTSNGVTFSAQGSDANINTFISSKGTGVTVFNTGVGEQFRVATISNAVNNLQAYGATIGNAPAIGARGTDANVDIALIPKGTGRVKFGTYTAGMLINTGYIEIVDSGGTVRKLAVVA